MRNVTNTKAYKAYVETEKQLLNNIKQKKINNWEFNRLFKENLARFDAKIVLSDQGSYCLLCDSEQCKCEKP